MKSLKYTTLSQIWFEAIKTVHFGNLRLYIFDEFKTETKLLQQRGAV